MLRLTNKTSRVIGRRVFYPKPIRFKNSPDGGQISSFSIAFAFAIVSELPKLNGHGFAFVISPTQELVGALLSQFLGLLNSSDNGNATNHLLAVEFDTVQDFELQDINDNHVGVDNDSLVSLDRLRRLHESPQCDAIPFLHKTHVTIILPPGRCLTNLR